MGILACGTGLASHSWWPSAQVNLMKGEVIALLFPDPGQPREGPGQLVTAVMRDAQGLMELRDMKPDKSLFREALLTGRFNCGKPIVDPLTREVIGYEIEPMAVF
jgi:hypothetical protein